MRPESGQGTFPLPLTAFENYMHVDDRSSHPMAFVIAIDVSGDLRVESMQAAIHAALPRHPLLSSCVATGLRGRSWIPTAAAPVIEVCSLDSSPQLSPLDLKREPGLRVWIQHAAEGGRISFQFHHAATDGLGAMQFIGDVLALYAKQTAEAGQEVPELRPVDHQTLHRRGAIIENPNADTRPPFLKRLGALYRSVGHSASSLAVPPAENVASRSQASAPEDSLLTLPPYASRLGERPVLLGLKRLASQRTVHLNDIYMAVLFRTVFEWNRKYGQPDDRRLIRLAVPSSLRTPEHDLSPAANILNLVFVNRRESECGDFEGLLSRASEAANGSTHDRLFCEMVWWGRMIPGVMEVCTRLPYTFATIVLTNVGEVKRQFRTRFPLDRGRCIAGSVTLEGLRGTAPIRPGTHVAVSIGSYAGRLFVNATCDPNLYRRGDADRFLNMYFQQLCELAEAAA